MQQPRLWLASPGSSLEQPRSSRTSASQHGSPRLHAPGGDGGIVHHRLGGGGDLPRAVPGPPNCYLRGPHTWVGHSHGSMLHLLGKYHLAISNKCVRQTSTCVLHQRAPAKATKVVCGSLLPLFIPRLPVSRQTCLLPKSKTS